MNRYHKEQIEQALSEPPKPRKPRKFTSTLYDTPESAANQRIEEQLAVMGARREAASRRLSRLADLQKLVRIGEL